MKRATVGCVILGVLFLGVCQRTWAQEEKPDAQKNAKEPKPKLEAFQAKQGVVIVKGFSEVGKIDGLVEAGRAWLVTVDSREITDASSGKKFYGVFVTVVNEHRDQTSCVEYDDIDALLKGIDYIIKLDKSVTKLDSFQADYRANADLTVSVFSNEKGIIHGSVTCGAIAGVSEQMSIESFRKFRGFIEQGKKRLESIRQ